MSKSIFRILALIILFFGAFSPAISSAQAQTPPPPREPERQQPCLPGQPCEDENGEQFIIPTEESVVAPTAIGDSDDYGYTLSSATYSWINAADGINTSIDDTYDITAAISLPFAFPFYENSYTQLYITGAGYLTFDDYDWVNWGDFIPDEDAPAPAEAAAYSLLKEQIEEVLGSLNEREQKVLKLRFGLEDGRARTLEEVGKEFDVTRERIRQIEAKALRKLRHPSRSKKLRDYLD